MIMIKQTCSFPTSYSIFQNYNSCTGMQGTHKTSSSTCNVLLSSFLQRSIESHCRQRSTEFSTTQTDQSKCDILIDYVPMSFRQSEMFKPTHENIISRYTQLRFVFLNFPFVCQNVAACLKLNRSWLAIVYYTVIRSAAV